MRISKNEIEIIKNSILSKDKNTKVFLFGSRTDDSKRGGDIDILILSDKISLADVIDIKVDIFNHMEEQKIDIVVAKRLDENPFIKKISKELVAL